MEAFPDQSKVTPRNGRGEHRQQIFTSFHAPSIDTTIGMPPQHTVQLHTWLQEQNKELEIADSSSEVQLQLEILERQYEQLCHRHNSLLTQGQEANKQVQQLDQAMFSGATPGKKNTELLEEAMAKLVRGRETLEREATPQLRLLREGLQYHSLDKQAQKVGVVWGAVWVWLGLCAEWVWLK